MRRTSALLAGVLAFGTLGVAAAESPPGSRAIRGLVVLTGFPDVRHPVRPEYARRRFFEELDAYVREVSGGAARVTGDVTKRWVTLPRGVGEYRISPRNLEVDRTRVQRLIDDALEAVGDEYDVSAYDFTALFLGARREEYGMIGLCGFPGMLGWSGAAAPKTRGGREVRGGIAIFSYQAHLGTLFHDVAHVLGGVRDGKRVVPCLYDHDLQARPGPLRETFLGAIVNLGFWDPMSCHYVTWEKGPPGISSWTRLRLGWLDERRVKVVPSGAVEEVVLAPLGDPGPGTQVVRVPLGETTYLLIENRQPSGFDANLPGSGVLILRSDDSVAECRNGRSPVRLVNADPSVPRLEGAAFGGEGRRRYADESGTARIEVLEKTGRSFKVRVDRSRG